MNRTQEQRDELERRILEAIGTGRCGFSVIRSLVGEATGKSVNRMDLDRALQRMRVKGLITTEWRGVRSRLWRLNRGARL